MKIEELRIGNLVKASNNTIDILNITCVGLTYVFLTDEYEDYDSTPEDLIPIPLTKEWLIKFGFIKRNERMYTLLDEEIHIVNGKLMYRCYKLIELKYVHQLQNLYFALTGYELQYIA